MSNFNWVHVQILAGALLVLTIPIYQMFNEDSIRYPDPQTVQMSSIANIRSAKNGNEAPKLPDDIDRYLPSEVSYRPAGIPAVSLQEPSAEMPTPDGDLLSGAAGSEQYQKFMESHPGSVEKAQDFLNKNGGGTEAEQALVEKAYQKFMGRAATPAELLQGAQMVKQLLPR